MKNIKEERIMMTNENEWLLIEDPDAGELVGSCGVPAIVGEVVLVVGSLVGTPVGCTQEDRSILMDPSLPSTTNGSSLNPTILRVGVESVGGNNKKESERDGNQLSIQ